MFEQQTDYDCLHHNNNWEQQLDNNEVDEFESKYMHFTYIIAFTHTNNDGSILSLFLMHTKLIVFIIIITWQCTSPHTKMPPKLKITHGKYNR